MSNLGFDDLNLATGLLFGFPIGLIAALSIRGIGSLHRAGRRLAFVSCVVAVTAVTTATYLELPTYPASNIQGPFWIFHTGIYLGLLPTSFVAISLGQFAGHSKSEVR